MKLSIVVPCYNSEHTIEKLVDLAMQEFDHRGGWELEMVLVNDFSRDDTFGAIKRACAKYPNVKGVSLARNFGQHGALMCAFQYVTGDVVCGIDDDLQNHPAQIHQLLDRLLQEDDECDVVFGKYRKRNFGWFKNLTGKVSQWLLFHLIDRPRDVEMSAFWVARRYVIEEMKHYRGTDAFVQLLFARTTRRMADVEVEHYKREVGTSNYTFRKGLRLFMSFMSFSVIPLHIATWLGVVFSAAGFTGALVILIAKLLHADLQVGWPSLMVVILITGGFLFLMLGIIGDYLGKLVMTENHSPLYVVRDTVNVPAEDRKDRKGQTPRRRQEGSDPAKQGQGG